MDEDQEVQGEMPASGPEEDSLEAESEGTLEDTNLVAILEADADGKEWLEKLGKRAVDDFEDDQQSNKNHYERCANDIRMFLGISDEWDNGPAKGKKKPALPMLSKLVLRITSRMSNMIVQTEPIPVPTGDEDDERAERISKHIQWEKRAKHPEWNPGMRKSIMQSVLVGECVRYVGWDPVKNRKLIEYHPIEDFVYPYTESDPTYNFENTERWTRVLRIRRHKLEQYGDGGYFLGVENLFADDAEKKPTAIDPSRDVGPIRKLLQEFEGITPKTPKEDKDKGNPCYLVLERHSWERLPEVVDGSMHRVAAWVEKSTKKVLRLVIMEREDPIDRLRFENEQKYNELRLQNYQQEKTAFLQQQQQALMAAQQAQAMGQPPPPGIEQVLNAPPPEEPELEEPDPIRMTPVFPAIRYPFIDNPEGALGLGIGLFATELNMIANDLMGEHILAHRLAAIGSSSGFTSREAKDVKGIEELEFGKFKNVPTMDASELQTAFKNFPFEPPRSNPAPIIEYFDTELQGQTASSDALSGMPGPDRETAAAAKIRAANAVTAITNAMEKMLEPLAMEYREYGRLNALFGSDAEYFFVTVPDPNNPTKGMRKKYIVSREDYEADYDITFDSDARMALDPGYGQAALQAHMMVMQSPFADPNIKLAAEKKALKALKADDLVAMYPESIPPPPPPSPMSQVDETAGFMTGKDHPVLPDDDDVQHLNDLAEFEQAGMYGEMDKTAKQLFDRHKAAHQAQAYKKGKAIQAQLGGSNVPMGQPQPGGAGGMGGGPGDQGPQGQAPGAG